MLKKIECISDRIAVKLDAPEETSDGVYLPETIRRKPYTGTVMSTGPLVRQITEGDTVVFTPGTGVEVTVNGNPLLVMREVDTLCII